MTDKPSSNEPIDRTTAETAEPANDSPNAGRPKRGGGLVAWLALLTAIGGIGGGYYLYQQKLEPLLTLPSRLSQQGEQTAGQLAEQAEAISRLARQQALQQEALNLDQQRFHGLEQNLATIRGQAFWTTREWKLSEIRYLVRMAQDRLQLMQDRATARRAVEAALGRLAELADPTLEPLRQRLQHDLQRLAIPSETDPAAIIATLEQQIARLRPYPRPPRAEGTEPQETPATAETKAAPTDRLLSLLTQRIRVVHHDRPLDALDGSRVAARQLELLKMRLLTLRLALAQNNPTFYRHALDGIDLWLQDNALGADGEAIAAELARLRDIDPFTSQPSLQPTLDLIASLLGSHPVVDTEAGRTQ